MVRDDGMNRELAKQADDAEKTESRKTERRPDSSAEHTGESEQERGTGDLKGLGQAGTAEPQPGVASEQGGGIEDAIGGGQSGQGGG